MFLSAFILCILFISISEIGIIKCSVLQKDSLQTTTPDKMSSTQEISDEHLEKKSRLHFNRN